MRRPLADALIAADAVVSLLAPGCERIEVAGSIRRKSAEVKDIEIVAVPRFAADLLGGQGADLLNQAVLDAVRGHSLWYRHVRTGERIVGYEVDARRFFPLLYEDDRGLWPVDLFVVRPPAQWGAIFAIRTGPADYSARMVTKAKEHGVRCEQGRLVDDEGRTVDTPEERDFIEACGLPFLPPEQRR